MTPRFHHVIAVWCTALVVAVWLIETACGESGGGTDDGPGPTLKDSILVSWVLNLTCMPPDSVLRIYATAKDRETLIPMGGLRIVFNVSVLWRPSCSLPGLPDWLSSSNPVGITDSVGKCVVIVPFGDSPFLGAPFHTIEYIRVSSITRQETKKPDTRMHARLFHSARYCSTAAHKVNSQQDVEGGQ